MKRYRSVRLSTEMKADDEIVLSEDFGEGLDEELSFEEMPVDEAAAESEEVSAEETDAADEAELAGVSEGIDE